MKKALSVILASLLAVGTFTACGTSDGASSTAPDASVADSASDALEDTAPKDGVTIRAVTSYGANDGNRVHYEAAYKAWEKETGNTVVDESEVSNEAWKSRILADFQTGSQGDIVFFFNGVDGNPLVEADKVVSLDEIIAQYPDFASNMDMTKIPDSPADGKKYAVPTTGYWEGMYVNKAVLEKAGAEMPGATTTWEEFLEICQTVKDAGFTPIAASLNEVPHYWFEFTVMNNIGQANHLEVPAAAGDKASKAWAGAFTDMKELYDMGFFPEDTNTASNDEVCQMMLDNEAAFLVEGSWKAGWFAENAPNLDDFAVTYIPAKGERAPTDIIGGLSMGYYITRKAWDDESKRDAAVSFVQAMTSDEVVNNMAAGTAATALAAGITPPADSNSLMDYAMQMINGSTTITPAVEDLLTQQQRDVMLNGNTKLIMAGGLTPEESVTSALELE